MTSYQDELDRQADALTEADERRRAEWRWPTPRAADLFPDEPDPRTPLEIAAQRVADGDAEARTARTEWIALLPKLDPTTLACTACGSTDDFDVVEIGHQRITWSVTVENPDSPHHTRRAVPAAERRWVGRLHRRRSARMAALWLHCHAVIPSDEYGWTECDQCHQMPENVEWS